MSRAETRAVEGWDGWRSRYEAECVARREAEGRLRAKQREVEELKGLLARRIADHGWQLRREEAKF